VARQRLYEALELHIDRLVTARPPLEQILSLLPSPLSVFPAGTLNLVRLVVDVRS
jgi:hypothetical protein